MGLGLIWLWMLAIWIMIVLLAVWAAGLLFPRVPSPGTSTPRDILEGRHARGELTRGQYDDRRKGPS